MRRREFIAGLGGAAAVWPRAAKAQQQGRRRPLVAWLGGSTPQAGARNLNAFLAGLKEHGHEDGKTIDIVYRWAEGDLTRQLALAKELVALSPDVIMTANGPGTVAVRQATETISIVGALISDPVKLGLADSHNRPGRNVTGVLQSLEGLSGKQTGLLLEVNPSAKAIGVLANSVNPSHEFMLREIENALRPASISMVTVVARSPAEIALAFDTLASRRVDGLVILQDEMFFTEGVLTSRLRELAVPAIHGYRQHVEGGGLMSYAVDTPRSFQRAAYFVDRILKGVRPGELPLELPNKFEFVINLKTAKALGLSVPSKLLFTADEVIE